MNITQLILFVKVAQAGSGTASDVNYLFLMIILLLSFLLGLIYLHKAILNFIHHYKDQDNIKKEGVSESYPFENGNA